MTASPTTRSRTLIVAIVAAIMVTSVALVARPSDGDAATSTTPDPVNTVVLHMSGSMKFTLDKGFQKTLKGAKARVKVKDGAKLKGRNITLPIDSSTTITLNPGTADVVATGTIMFRRPNGQKVVAQDVTLRLRDTGADLSSTLRGRPQKELAALTISPTTAVQQVDSGYQFVDIQMLVSNDMAAAARKAHIKGVKAGALFGLLNAQIRADVPSFTLPGVDVGNTSLLPGLGG